MAASAEMFGSPYEPKAEFSRPITWPLLLSNIAEPESPGARKGRFGLMTVRSGNTENDRSWKLMK
jgi:hypothetical protein